MGAALRARSSDLAELRALLAAAAQARAAAEAKSLEYAAARVMAEEARAAAEVSERLEQKRHWFTRLAAISSAPAAESVSCADEKRRGAPEPELAPIDGILGGFPVVDGEAAAAAWATACALAASAWRPPLLKPGAAAAGLSENRDVHPVIRGVLGAVAGHRLRVWHDEETPDDACTKAHLWPDFVLSDARDAMASVFGALVIVEVKLPGGITAAATQMRAALRRRVAQLCREADARGESLDDAATVFGVGTDGAQVVIARMSSGAPRAGESFADAIPCPVRETAPLPLFPSWDLRQPPPVHLAAGPPPAGFAAMLRLCGAPHLLGGGGALASLRVRLQRGAEPASASPRTEMLALTSRLGTGGTSDVYSCGGDSCGDDRGGPLAVKVARFSTRRVAGEFSAERAALAALRGAAAAGLVPEVVAHGEREALAALSSSTTPLPWPVLLLRPCGEPLEAWVAQRAGAAERAAAAAGGAAAAVAAAAAAARIAAADAIVHRVLDALDAAHAAGWVHCDVRPSNVVVAAPHGACLVDWGAAHTPGAALSYRGVAAFADERIFSARGVAARPHVDALAALYTWLAVALGRRCTAPWLVPDDGERIDSDEALFMARSSWLRARRNDDCAEGARVAAAVRAAHYLERLDGRSAEDALALARRALCADGAGAADLSGRPK